MYDDDYRGVDDFAEQVKADILAEQQHEDRRVELEHEEQFGSASDGFRNHERIDRRR